MYACIDLGSNSFHLLIAEWNNGDMQLVERCSEKVQLGAGIQANGNITEKAFKNGIECLKHFNSLIHHHGVLRYWALGTNTFRIAKNADSFVQAAVNIGIDISIITGVQEALLVYAGVCSALEDSDEQRLVIDIGGGSTEVIVGERNKRLITHSLPVGCVAWKDRFFTTPAKSYDELSDNLNQATLAAKEVFNRIAPGIKKYNWVNAYGSSGTAKMLSTVCHEHGAGGGYLTISALNQLLPDMLNAIVEGHELPGLKEKRRELLLPGCAVMSGLMSALECESIAFSASALREGMLDFMVNNSKTAQILADDNLPDVSYAGS